MAVGAELRQPEPASSSTSARRSGSSWTRSGSVSTSTPTTSSTATGRSRSAARSRTRRRATGCGRPTSCRRGSSRSARSSTSRELLNWSELLIQGGGALAPPPFLFPLHWHHRACCWRSPRRSRSRNPSMRTKSKYAVEVRCAARRLRTSDFVLTWRSVPCRCAPASARRTIRSASASTQAQAFYDQGLAYLHSYVWIEAARSFNQALRLDPKLALAHLGLTIAYTELNAAAAARAALERAQALARRDRARSPARRGARAADGRGSGAADAAKLAAYRARARRGAGARSRRTRSSGCSAGRPSRPTRPSAGRAASPGRSASTRRRWRWRRPISPHITT